MAFVIFDTPGILELNNPMRQIRNNPPTMAYMADTDHPGNCKYGRVAQGSQGTEAIEPKLMVEPIFALTITGATKAERKSKKNSEKLL